MEAFITMDDLREAVAAIRQQTDLVPRVGMILGSGLNALANAVRSATADSDRRAVRGATAPALANEGREIPPGAGRGEPVRIDFDRIPHFPVSTVEGHQGRLVLGTLEGVPVAVMQGRTHYYEGYTMGQIGLPVRVMALLGVEILIVTNAAGGLNMTYRPGEVMIIRDHINLLGMAGVSPLRGPNLDQFGPRFPSMNDAYDPELRESAREIALEAKIPIQQGVYICLAGPNFESPADVRFLRTIGADAVGMSTVPEVITARHSGLRVLGLSGITNTLLGEEGGTPPNHEEVIEAGQTLVPRLETIIRGILQRQAAA